MVMMKRSHTHTHCAPLLLLLQLLVIFLCFCKGQSPSHVKVANFIKQGQQLSNFETLVSPESIFTLGFFNFKPSTWSYLGIWNERGTYVWIANRDNPISDSTGVLTIDADGILKIKYDVINSKSIILSSQKASNGSTVTATLLNSGNFVLNEIFSNGTGHRVLWQSFDYPTDVLLTGMKLGQNLKTGKNWSLTSWIGDENPASGAFTLEIDRNGTNQLVITRRGEVYWRSGVWDGTNFENVPELTKASIQNHRFNNYEYLYNFSFVSNKEERYFSFSAMLGSSSKLIWLMSSMGGLDMIEMDSVRTYRDDYLVVCRRTSTKGCVGNMASACRSRFEEFERRIGDMSGVPTRTKGCVGNKPSACRSGDEEFEQRSGAYMSGVPTSTNDPNLGLSDCETQCRNNCSCVAFASMTREGIGCYFWAKGSNFTEYAYYSREIYLLPSKQEKEKKNWWIWLIIAVAIALVISLLASLGYLAWKKLKLKEAVALVISLLASLGYLAWKKLKLKEAVALVISLLASLGYLAWKKLKLKEAVALVMSLLASLIYLVQKKLEPRGETDTIEKTELLELETIERHGREDHGLMLFKFDTILAATDNFSPKNKLGEGGFGPVYKGRLLEGEEIAVKRLSGSSKQGSMEFKNEVGLIAKLQHRNLVRLLGSCIKGDKKMLIYEYMPNKSLDSILFGPMRTVLDWKKRVNIIEGIAQGLLYLHYYSRLRVIHRDLKASNILLDNEMNPRISDFGLARIFGLTESEAKTKKIAGTRGYMSPEYIMKGIFSEKSDVFSFGVLLLEIVSGKKNNTHFSNNGHDLNLIEYAWDLCEKGACIELMDPMLDTSFPKDKMLRYIQVGLLCVQESATDRPTMLDVVYMFANDSPLQKRPTFSTGGKPESCFVNDLTMAVIEARTC